MLRTELVNSRVDELKVTRANEVLNGFKMISVRKVRKDAGIVRGAYGPDRVRPSW